MDDGHSLRGPVALDARGVGALRRASFACQWLCTIACRYGTSWEGRGRDILEVREAELVWGMRVGLSAKLPSRRDDPHTSGALADGALFRSCWERSLLSVDAAAGEGALCGASIGRRGVVVIDEALPDERPCTDTARDTGRCGSLC